MTRAIAICADDFGIDAGVNEAILNLSAQGRLSAASCLVQAPYFASDAKVLAASSVDIGLHLNFTECFEGVDICKPVSHLIVDTYVKRLPADRVVKQIERQLDLFDRHIGRAPDFVDGHEHVHQLPVIRDALLRILSQRYPGQPLWVRSTRPGLFRGCLNAKQRFKAHLIGALGSKRLRLIARQYGFKMNAGFVGVYDFSSPHPDYLRMLEDWLAHATDGTLLMAHPATRIAVDDRYGSDRILEYQALGSHAFAEMLGRLDTRITRLSNLNLPA